MGETIHIIPVGFDFQRLAQPITQGDLEADRILLLHSTRDASDTEAQQLAERMVNRLQETLGTLFGKEIETRTVEDIFDFETAYQIAYKMIQHEIESGNEVWVNISSMPRTVAFAFASAANSIIVEEPEYRESVHTYYVSTDEYLVTRMIRELRNEKEFLQNLVESGTDQEKAESRLNDISELVAEIEDNGTTKGADQIVEFPAIPTGELHQFEKSILYFLQENGSQESISALSEQLAEAIDEEVSPGSFKSKVQYNVTNLEEQGFIERKEVKNKHEISLDTMGKLWVKSHPEDQPPNLRL